MRVDGYRIFAWFYLIVGITTGAVSDLDYAPGEQGIPERPFLMGAFWPMYWLIRITLFHGGINQ